jgi:hypothetical protein
MVGSCTKWRSNETVTARPWQTGQVQKMPEVVCVLFRAALHCGQVNMANG